MTDDDYSNEAAAAYWGVERLHDVPVGVARAEDLAVLCKGKPEAVADGYARWELTVLDEHLGSAPVGTVLEVGCGVGRILDHVGGRATSLLGVDISPKMIERATRRLSDHPDAKLLVGPADELPVSDGSVDTVICFGVLEHMPADRQRRAIREMARVLRPGGQLVLELNNRSVFLADGHNDNPYRRGEQLANGYYCEVVDADALLAEAHDAGLSISDQRSNPFFSVVRHLVPEGPDLAQALSFAVDLDLRCRPDEARVVCDQLICCLVRGGA